MEIFLLSAYRIASWIVAGSLGLLGAIVLCDGLTSSLAAHYRAATLIVSLLFIMAGLGFFALERNLTRSVRRSAVSPNDARSYD
jgi:heme A synthase